MALFKAEAPVLITIGGEIGYLKLIYDWNGHRYEAITVNFKRSIPPLYQECSIRKCFHIWFQGQIRIFYKPMNLVELNRV
ncbi:hypothetical protein [Neobacillus bataviensis]|uniref:hypothetical protein n=1 Tax=Neobacillus bataviensis TaxID=220685 RepID=UPI001CC0F35B|nr:hypothetical protein [Neobacillus bataviensis]